MAATDGDGFPTNVASGELIESAWGTAVATKLRRVPRGLLRRVAAGAQGGHGATETPIPGLSLLIPPSTNPSRLYQVGFAVAIVPNVIPSNQNSVILITARVGAPPSGTLVETMGWPYPLNSSANGWTLAGTIQPQGFAPGSSVVLSTFSDGNGRYNIVGGWAALFDVTSPNPA